MRVLGMKMRRFTKEQIIALTRAERGLRKAVKNTKPSAIQLASQRTEGLDRRLLRGQLRVLGVNQAICR
jgi:hypothetical protein